MAKKVLEKKKKEDLGALFIPAGIFLGMGFGFLFGDFVAGLFIGMGTGFLLFAITKILKRK
jgi:hypothetical protein